MARGRKPLPTEIKKLRGTDQPCRILDDEMAPPPISNIPAPPDGMRDIAKSEWYRIVGELSSLKILSNLDLALIEIYCNEYCVYLEMEQTLQKNGRVIFYKDKDGHLLRAQAAPHQRIADRAVEKMLKIAAEFGFTPSARTRISAGLAALKDEEDANEFTIT